MSFDPVTGKMRVDPDPRGGDRRPRWSDIQARIDSGEQLPPQDQWVGGTSGMPFGFGDPRKPGGFGSCPRPEEHIQLANNDWILAGELKVGDEVITSKEPQKVTFAKIIEDSPRREVLFTEGDSIVTSPSHPYFVKDKGFVDVEDLKEGDAVGDLIVSEVKPFSDGPVIHISVDKAQTYMLRGGTEENPVPALSHNKKPPGPERPVGTPPSFVPITGNDLGLGTTPPRQIATPITDRRYQGIDVMPITTQPMPEFPNLKRPGFRPPRRPEQPRRNTGGFDNDYSFLNLPRAGSDVGGPIPLPSMDPVGYQSQVDRYAPNDLPNVDLVAPSYQPLSVEESQSVLDSARPFEDSASLGANQEERFAELGRFFGEKVSGLQGNIDELINTKSQLTKDLEAAFLQQDEMSQQAIEEQIAALDAQRVELVAQLEQSVAEAESQGVDAVSAAEQVTAEQQQQFEGQLQEIQAAQQQAIAERDQAIAEQDNIRAQAADEQVQALEGLKQQLLTEREGIVGGFEEKIGGLQGEINSLTGARDSAITERDDAIANQDVIRAEAADAQVQALEEQKTTLETQYNQTIGDLQGQLDALNTSQVVAETPGAGLPADIAVNENVADLGFEPPEPELRTNGDEPPLGQNKPPIYYTPEDPAPEVAPSPLISPLGTVDMSKINLPENYMDAINNIQPPQNFNFNNLGIGMNQGGEASRIQLLLNRLRR